MAWPKYTHLLPFLSWLPKQNRASVSRDALVGLSGATGTFVLVSQPQIASVQALKGKRLYLPQQDSLRSYIARANIVLPVPGLPTSKTPFGILAPKP